MHVIGQLKVENFFKWEEHLSATAVAIDNVLARLDGVQVRAKNVEISANTQNSYRRYQEPL